MGGKAKRPALIQSCLACRGSKQVETDTGRCWGCHQENSQCSSCYQPNGYKTCRHCDETGYAPRRVVCKTCNGKGRKDLGVDFDRATCNHCYEGERTEYYGTVRGKLDWYHYVRGNRT